MPTKSNNTGGRGGKRAGAGRKKKATIDKINDSDNYIKLEVMDIPDFQGEDIPEPHQYLLDEQRDGNKLLAEEIYNDTWEWLKKCNCSHLVQKSIVEYYAMNAARYIQCETMNSKAGLLSKHPTTGSPIPSPFVNMAIQYMNQATRIWNDIFQIVKENCTIEISANNPQDTMMERLLKNS